MKKKIKNSNFMNLIWFIVAILPILFIAIYSINYFLNKDLIYEYQNTPIENQIDQPTSMVKAQYDSGKNYITFDNTISGPPIVSIWSASFLENQNSLWLYFFDNSLDDIKITITGTGANNSSINVDLLISNDNKPIDFVKFKNDNNFVSYNSIIINSLSNTNLNNGEIIYYFISDVQLNMSKEEIKNYCVSNNLFSINNYDLITSYSLYLEMILSSFLSSGFIANIFITLLSYFSITSVYANLLCYYLEYLVLTMLLHLAFDFLLLIPNIAHNFLDKIGGERE